MADFRAGKAHTRRSLIGMRQRIHWFAMHGFIRRLVSIGVRRGEPQARMIADPAVRANPVPFIEELRSQGRIVKGRVVYLTVDHELSHELLRSEDFRVTELGRRLEVRPAGGRSARPAS